ncbi:hypothetical protein SAMN02910358_00139 [Lachnospiraceae bacterium XBB1006]|nr:hypothetical protein SAMN02910358_00139 [Lachnospiraceae bacterium XBB1006]
MKKIIGIGLLCVAMGIIFAMFLPGKLIGSILAILLILIGIHFFCAKDSRRCFWK